MSPWDPMQESALVGTDLTGAFPMMGIFPLGVCAAFTLPAGICTLVGLIGPSAFVGVSLMVVLMACSLSLAPKIKRAAAARLQRTDARVHTTREVIDGARVVKLQQWEESFLRLLSQKRTTELATLRKLRVISTMAVVLGRASPIVAAAVSFATAAAFGADLAPSRIFPALARA